MAARLRGRAALRRGGGRDRPTRPPPCVASSGGGADLSGFGVQTSGVAAGAGQYGRGLLLTSGVKAGAVVAAAPLDGCLAAHRDGQLAVPSAPWSAFTRAEATWGRRLLAFHERYPLPWDVRLGLALCDCLDPDDAHSAAATSAWSAYARDVLPAAAELPSPLVLDEDEAADWLQVESLVERYERDRSELRASCPSVDQNQLAWGVACARSRAFGASPDVFVLAPVLDVANHAFAEPSASVRLACGPEGAEAAALEHHPNGTLQLVAERDLEAGDEVTYSYGLNREPAVETYWRYGFCRPGGSPHERLDFGAAGPAGVDAARVEDALRAEVDAAGGRWLRERASDTRLGAVLASLPPGSGEAGEAEGAAALLELARARLSALPTSAEEDAALLQAAGLTPAQRAAVEFRREHKLMWERAVGVLETYEAAMQPSLA